MSRASFIRLGIETCVLRWIRGLAIAELSRKQWGSPSSGVGSLIRVHIHR